MDMSVLTETKQKQNKAKILKNLSIIGLFQTPSLKNLPGITQTRLIIWYPQLRIS